MKFKVFPFLVSTTAAFAGRTSQTRRGFSMTRLEKMNLQGTRLPGQITGRSWDNDTMSHQDERVPEEIAKRNPKFRWDKDTPKKSLEHVGQSHTAAPWILNLVEGMHWFLFLPTFMSSFAVLKYNDVWFSMFGGDTLRVALWLLAPTIVMCAGIAPIVTHMYEDWQVAPSMNPDYEEYDPQVYVDERLRQVGYSVLFTGLGLAAIMQFVAYQGYSLSTIVPSLGLFAYGALGDKRNMVSDYLTPFFAKDGNADGIQVLPLPVSTMVFFVFSQILVSIFAFMPLASQIVDEGHMSLKLAIVLPQMCFMAGGMLEACGAEVKFDQRLHLMAVLSMTLGAATQYWSFLQLGQYLS